MKSKVLCVGLVLGITTATLTVALKTVVASPVMAAYSEPVVLTSQDGVLEVNLTAAPGEGRMDTVALPVKNMLLFSYKVIKGNASNGQLSGENLYPAPTLNVQPGQTLIVHLENKMLNLEIDDFFDPAYTLAGKKVALTPRPLALAPFNFHTHGLHVSPMGNSDNVLLMMPAGARNTYEFKIPSDHAEGMYWYHGHLHTLTTAQTYMGLAGLLVIGRADGNIPAVTENKLPIRNMALQYNFVSDRKDGGHQLNNPNWGQFVSTLTKPEPGELESGSYKPSLAPVNFPDAPAGTHFVTNWWEGPLDIENHRGQFELIPNNLIDFKANKAGTDLPADPNLPDSKRDVQFTVNGQFQPRISSRPGQTEIWNLANISDLAYIRLRLTETATGKHPPFVIVGQDGLPYTRVQTSTEQKGTVLSIPPASRYAIAVTIPKEGELILDMPPAHDLHQIFKTGGVEYTSKGGKPASATLGTVSVNPKYISYFDGFFLFPTQVVLRAAASGDGQPGKTVPFTPGQALGAHTAFAQIDGSDVAVKRKIIINGGFLDTRSSLQEPKAFVYAFNGRAFPNTSVLRARLDTTEEWAFVNYNNDEHPIHIHVNDIQVTKLVDPVAHTDVRFQPWAQDNVNVPAPLMGPHEKVIKPGEMTFRTRFQDFLGSYVTHCHRLNHEDNGLMALVNVIPSRSSYAVAHSGQVQIRDGKGGPVLASLTPFAGYPGPLSLAMCDIDGDGILDLVVGTGPGVPAQVAAFCGAGKAPFQQELARFSPFAKDFSGGVCVAAGNLDGRPSVNNIVVGAGPGMESRVRIFSSTLPKVGEMPRIAGTFLAYPGQHSGVNLTVGMIESGSGLNSIITAPGPGQPAIIRVFRYEIENPEFCIPTSGPKKIAEFPAFDSKYSGGVSLACDWTSCQEGGAQMIVVGQSAAPGAVRAYSSGCALDGFPEMYNETPGKNHNGPVKFHSVLSFIPFAAAPGVTVATTSTNEGADLLVSSRSAKGRSEVRKYKVGRAQAKATSLSARSLGNVDSVTGEPGSLGGD